MAPSKAKDPGTFGKQTGENSPLNLKRSAPFLRHTPSTRDYSPLFRAPHSKNPPKNTCFELELLQPCSKKEDSVTLRQKGLETIAILSQDNFAIAYTDGSSDRFLSNGGAGVILILPYDNNYKHKINTGIIASNFTSEFMAIREALILY
ncbi:hypothetical protein TNCV_3133021 [Trichonephila clavipes]|nr:hypothetical protein TNCV_3133021 [Trichonephila clavipes]